MMEMNGFFDINNRNGRNNDDYVIYLTPQPVCIVDVAEIFGEWHGPRG
jgi:hypothetical protein